ncbi:bifunctional adenosylcobinamide kinase/adenosylcobinamide-phosphate guanylyltransferase [Hespellia stercorisuis]|uniref:Adenosylcobinamide kinase n=1 Tax=Hespellia stercorisuis DSM 15480 TaxID=1121950 RepID=A0A1M6KIP1_9FIRM|nr:bifunctional adenosylcobinamide kinase/adenosylcobinamide-phosphate guanylyltransferase [Hespellia stercorisuis]SHJ58814.1 adenosylcobinamide kinase /adenosylcobinamide-phosphate guanylyltransferase [Hespellia stercorisuis DSM 15480]
MELYIGGYAQGKQEYVRSKKSGQDVEIVPDLHLWFRQLLVEEAEIKATEIKAAAAKAAEVKAEQVVLTYCEEHPDCVLICDEIGNGIVPMDQTERAYRERLGRLLIELAKRADRVERIICGIGQRLK